MRKRWIRRSLLVLIFTFFIIVFVDFQLRTSSSSFPKLNTAHRPSPATLHGSIAKDAQNSVSNSSIRRASKLNGNNGEESVAKGAQATLPKLSLDDIYIAVKTTGRFHETRLALLLDTWISRTKAHVSVCQFSDLVHLTQPYTFRQKQKCVTRGLNVKTHLYMLNRYLVNKYISPKCSFFH